MKHNIFLVLILMTCSKIANSQTDTNLQNLLKINYAAYKGHTVDSLVKNLPIGYIKTQILMSHRADYGDVLAVTYPNDVSVWIQVKQFKYMSPWINKTNKSLPPDINWNIPLFKKEALAFAIVYQGATCWAGCVNDPSASAP